MEKKDYSREELLQEVWNNKLDWIYPVAQRFFRNRDDVLDIAQEVFLKLSNGGAEKFVYGNELGPWIRGVTRNCAIDNLRSKRKHKTFTFSDVREYTRVKDPISSILDYEEDKGRRFIEDNEILEIAKKKIYQLPPYFRIIATKFFYLGRTYKQISEEEDIPIGTVKSRVSSARRIVREGLEGLDII